MGAYIFLDNVALRALRVVNQSLHHCKPPALAVGLLTSSLPPYTQALCRSRGPRKLVHGIFIVRIASSEILMEVFPLHICSIHPHAKKVKRNILVAL